ncbi:hypothetical protein F4805DRAFT_461085 [Annulohypoxylon moriforme]|nr:hypothetical protein F4805DRAFT_461085 [Annulohypoxylon moriforme]
MPTTTELGAIVLLTSPEKGDNVWTVKQSELRHHVNSGCVDTITYQFYVSVSLLGIQAGYVVGNIKDGVVVNIVLNFAKGGLNFYLKNEKEIWVHVDLDVDSCGHWDGDHKVLEW